MTPQEFDEQYPISKRLTLTLDEFDEKYLPTLTPQEFDAGKTRPKPQMQEAPWMARYPNLYAATAAISEEVPIAGDVARYLIDPQERRNYESYEVGIESPFVMTEQPDIPNKHLIDEELKLVAYLVGGPVLKYGVKPAAHFAMAKAEWLANKTVPKLPGLRKWLPKTYEAARKWLTKKRTIGGKQAILDREVAAEAAPKIQDIAGKIETDIDEAGFTTYRYFDKEGAEIGLGIKKGDIIYGIDVEPGFKRLGYGNKILEHLEEEGGKTAYKMSAEGKLLMESRGWKRKPGIEHPVYEKPPKSKALRTILGEPEPKIGPVEKFMAVRKKSKDLRKQQDILYSQERGKRLKKAEQVGQRIPGQAGYHAQLKELKGQLPKLDFEPLEKSITQKDLDDLYTMIRQSEVVTGFNNITAERGLTRLLEGQLARPSEEVELAKIFGEQFVKVMQGKGAWDDIAKYSVEALNIPRAIMSSYDVSAPFRQGLFLMPSHPKRFFGNFKPMFKSLLSEKAWATSQKEIAERPTYELMRESGLAIMELGSKLSLREEKFLSPMAEFIPGVRRSGRAYTTFLNRLRADVFDDLIKKADKLGRKASETPALAKEIAKFVNAASGRGNLGGLERSASTINAALFSPRLLSSRLTLLNPVYYVKADPFVRKEALKSLFAVSAMSTTVLTLAAAGGADVGLDPRSSDFLKIKVGGKTRIDILGGFQQYMRAAGQIISGKYVSSTTGKEYTLGEGYRPLTRLEILYRFVESKYSPIASFAAALMKGQDIKGDPINVPKEVGKRFVPMVVQDVYDLAVEDPELLPLAALGAFGVGLQTYGPRKRVTRGGFAPIKGIGGIKGF